jgi:RimJ/RimL family protein N-acetyltransferase
MLFDDAAYPPHLSDEEQFRCFANWVMQPSTLLYHYGTQAILGAYNIRPGICGHVVILFWDRKLYGPERIDIARRAAKFLVTLMHLHRLSAHIWSRNTASIQFSTKVGFQHEGVLRESWPKNGAWYDTIMLGALATEILAWPTNEDVSSGDTLFEEGGTNGHGRRRE